MWGGRNDHPTNSHHDMAGVYIDPTHVIDQQGRNMDTLVFELLSVDTLQRVREELGGYMHDQLKDVLKGDLKSVDAPVFEAFLTLQRVLDEKEVGA